MARVHVDGGAVSAFAGMLDRFIQSTSEERGLLLRVVVVDMPAHWRDTAYALFKDRFTRDADALHELELKFATLAGEFHALARRVDECARAPMSSAPVAAVAQHAPGALRPLSGRRGDLARVPISHLRGVTVKWTVADMHAEFYGNKHHGHSGDDYLELCRALPGVMAFVERGQRDFAPDSFDARVYDAFFGSDPIHVEVGADGAWDVKDGAHRLFGCMELGIDPPVELVRV